MPSGFCTILHDCHERLSPGLVLGVILTTTKTDDNRNRVYKLSILLYSYYHV